MKRILSVFLIFAVLFTVFSCEVFASGGKRDNQSNFGILMQKYSIDEIHKKVDLNKVGKQIVSLGNDIYYSYELSISNEKSNVTSTNSNAAMASINYKNVNRDEKFYNKSTGEVYAYYGLSAQFRYDYSTVSGSGYNAYAYPTASGWSIERESAAQTNLSPTYAITCCAYTLYYNGIFNNRTGIQIYCDPYGNISIVG